MGGAANICVILSDGSRRSVMAYNDAMSDLTNNFEFRSSPTDAQALKWLEQYQADTNDAYFKNHELGLCPSWYGLVAIDIPQRRIFTCQSYSSPGRFYGVSLAMILTGHVVGGSKEETMAPVVEAQKFADAGCLYLEGSPFRGTIHAKFSAHARLEIRDQWTTYRCDEMPVLYRLMRHLYRLSPDEHQHWKTWIKEH